MHFVRPILVALIQGTIAGAAFSLGNIIVHEAGKRSGLITPSKIQTVPAKTDTTDGDDL